MWTPRAFISKECLPRDLDALVLRQPADSPQERGEILAVGARWQLERLRATR